VSGRRGPLGSDEGESIRRETVLVLTLLATTAVCGVVAGLLGRSVWAAVLGGALVVAYWLLELLATKLGARGSFSNALAIGLGGMMIRFAVVLGVLVAVGLLARPAFPETALSFLVVYSVYQVLRLVAHPALGAHPKEQ
jgi:hypothetical protein